MKAQEYTSYVIEVYKEGKWFHVTSFGTFRKATQYCFDPSFKYRLRVNTSAILGTITDGSFFK